ncbi:MAG TPA: helix-turn-helix domain-containing protein [Mucilaginibacter sp.]|nr:helix-turn-helix domain-containing protein [Mucilaginibacter sp.]
MNHRQILIPLGSAKNHYETETLVEHRKLYKLAHCEVNIFETNEQCGNLDLRYNGLVISSMLRGKKTVGMLNQSRFDFLPGETLILPEGMPINVDFPDVDKKHPVQCVTMVIDWSKVTATLDYLNNTYPGETGEERWSLNFTQYHFHNNRELTGLIHKLIAISMEDNINKDALADITLTELLIRTIQTQKQQLVNNNKADINRLTGVIKYIRMHLTEQINIDALCNEACMSKTNFFRTFKDAFGLSPVEFIIQERIGLAKMLLKDPSINISEVCFKSGFNNLNYFIRLFKRFEGITPGLYLKS